MPWLPRFTCWHFSLLALIAGLAALAALLRQLGMRSVVLASVTIGPLTQTLTLLTVALFVAPALVLLVGLDIPYRIGIFRWRRHWLGELTMRRADIDADVRRRSAVDPRTGMQDTSDENLRAMEYDMMLVQFYTTRTDEARNVSSAPYGWLAGIGARPSSWCWRYWWMALPSSLPICCSTSGKMADLTPSPPAGEGSQRRGADAPLARLGRDQLRVDLRALQPPAVVHVDRLPLGEKLQRAQARFAVAVARAARPAERQLDLRADGARVHVNDPVESSRIATFAALISRVKMLLDSPKLRIVVDRDGLVQIAHLDQREHRPEDLLLRHPHIARHPAEQRRRVEAAPARSPSVAGSPPQRMRAPSSRATSIYACTRSRCAMLISGPTSVVSARPWPSRSVATRASSRSSNCARAPDWTITRLHAVQRCPAVPKADQTMPSTARSRSASFSTMMAFLPPSSSATRFSPRAASTFTSRPTSFEPVNEIARHIGVPHQRHADVCAGPHHEIQHARRQPGVLEDAHEVDGAERRITRRLEDHRIAGDQRGQRLPRRDANGKFHGVMQAIDAHRLAQAIRRLVRQLRRHDGPEEAPPLARHVVGHVDGFLHVAARLHQHLAHLARQVAGDLLFAILQQPRHAIEYLAAFGCGRLAPRREGRLRRRHRAVHVRLRRAREKPDQLAVRGIAVLRGLPLAASTHSPPI